jgi:hypothetical protein
MFLATRSNTRGQYILRNNAAARDTTITVYSSFFVATLLMGLTFHTADRALHGMAPAVRYELTPGEAIFWQYVREWNEKHSVMAKLKSAARKRATASR